MEDNTSTASLITILILNNEDITDYQIDQNSTIEELKLKIKDKEGYSIESQNLFINDKILENDKTLNHYNIQNDFILNLVINGERIILYAKPILGKKIPLDTKISEKIENIKKAIQKHEIIPIDLQILKYNNKILENNKTIKDYNIPNNSTIELSLDNDKYEIMSIYIIIEKKKHCINVINHLNLVKSIKIKLKRITKIPIEEQILYYHEKILSDDSSIDFYKIKHNSYLKLEFSSINIRIRRGYRSINAYFLKTEKTIKDLKREIEKVEDINYENQILKYGNIELEDNKTIKESNIKNDSIISLLYKSKGGIYIFVKRDNRLLTIEVNLNDKIEYVKDMINEKFGFKKCNYLNFAGKILDDKYYIEDYNIQKNSTLFIY